jgi:hypothetical protein
VAAISGGIFLCVLGMDPRHDAAFAQALQLLTNSHELPRMVVIDLDLTQISFNQDESLEHFSLIPEAVGTIAALKNKVTFQSDL